MRRTGAQTDPILSLETIHSRSTFETMAKGSVKDAVLKQNRMGFCCKCWAFTFVRVTVSDFGPNNKLLED
jgi:hypothetical protein